jgi:AAA15 family ATPase/GTPase
MNSNRQTFTLIWDQLRAKKNQLQFFLESIKISQLRGIESLQIPFVYPVSVIAGPNGCGKSTVLFACACAYDDQRREFFPAAIFPNLTNKTMEGPADKLNHPTFEYNYLDNNNKISMAWKKGKSWNKSFFGRKSAKQPARTVYLRTLANLTSPTEVRSILQINNKKYENSEIDASLIAFAHRVLDFRYTGLRLLKLKDKDLLFADRDDSSAYSEFHMSAGERALLRLSKDLSNLRDALVLIDEVEAGLHPSTQRQLMLELQRLALRNNLQIIVTTHSQTVLESVPSEARVFLEREGGNVTFKPAYRDIFQRALYGASVDKLSILCEDSVAEGLILGVLDVLNPKINLSPSDINVGRDTGKDQFPQHIQTLGKFRLLKDFIFVLDGDAKSLRDTLIKSGSAFHTELAPLFLPSDEPPEGWIYSTLEKYFDEYVSVLGAPNLQQELRRLRQEYDNATDKPTNIIKNRYETLANVLNRRPEDIARKIACHESQLGRGLLSVFKDELEQAILNWRQDAVSG